VLDFQLVSYSSVGRGSLQLADFEDQSRRKEFFPIHNSAQKVIGRLEMTVQYLYSLRRIYSDEIYKTQELIKQCEETIRQSQATIDTLYQIFPSEEKPDLNWDVVIRMRRHYSQRSSSGDATWGFLILGLCLALTAVNLLFAMVESNMLELAGCMILTLELLRDKSIGNFLSNVVVVSVLIAKDVLYMLLFNVTDSTALTQKLDGGGLMLEIVRWAHIPAIILKGVLLGCIFLINNKDS